MSLRKRTAAKDSTRSKAQNAKRTEDSNVHDIERERQRLEDQSMHSFAMLDNINEANNDAVFDVTLPSSFTTVQPTEKLPPRRNRNATVTKPAPKTRNTTRATQKKAQQNDQITTDTHAAATTTTTSTKVADSLLLETDSADSDEDSDDVGSISVQKVRPTQTVYSEDEESFVPPFAAATSSTTKAASYALPPKPKAKPAKPTHTPIVDPLDEATNRVTEGRLSDLTLRTTEDILNAQQTRRSAAKSALEMLRARQIPGLDDTRQRDIDNTERDIVIDRNTFIDSLYLSSGDDFQRNNKPVGAASLPPEHLRKVQNFILVNTLEELQMEQQDFYVFAVRVAGFIRVEPKNIVYVGPTLASQTQATRAVASSSSRYPGISSGGGREQAFGGGVGGDDNPSATSNAQTPFVVRDRRPNASTTTFESSFRTTGFASGNDDDNNEPFVSPQESPRDPLLQQQYQQSRQRVGAMNDAEITAEFANIVGGGNGDSTTMQSTSRFDTLRQQLEATRQKASYETENSDRARAINQQVRELGVKSLSWINQPRATGVYYYFPPYLTCRALAHAKLTARAYQLANVPPRNFMRNVNANTDPVQARVFIFFVVAVGLELLEGRYFTGSTGKLATDIANIAAYFDNTLEWFEKHVYYNKKTDTFYEKFDVDEIVRRSKSAWRRPAEAQRLREVYGDRSALLRRGTGVDSSSSNSRFAFVPSLDDIVYMPRFGGGMK